MQKQRLVVVVCSDTEWRIVRDILKPIEISTSVFGELFEHNDALFFQIGWTKTVAAAGVQYVIDTYHPERVINIGTCGGFEGFASLDDIFLITKAVIYDLNERMGNPKRVIESFVTTLDISDISTTVANATKTATIASADADVDSAHIETLHTDFGAIVADWESGSVAYVARLNNQKLHILRGVTDIVSREGGDVYGNERLFEKRAVDVLRKLVTLATKCS